MPVSKTWPGGTVDTAPTAFSIPLSGELNWPVLTNFLQALGDSAQATSFQKFGVRTATTTPVTVATTDCVVITNLAVAGAVAVTLPAGATKQVFVIVDGKGDAATNNVTITPAAGLINGAATYVLNKNRAGVMLIYNGTGWTVVSEFNNLGGQTIAVVPAEGAVYSTGAVLATTGAFATNGNKLIGVNNGATATEYKAVTMTAAGETTFPAQLRISDGTVGEPSIVFSSDDDTSGTGFYRISANRFGIANDGVLTVNFGTASTTFAQQILSADGTVGSPALGFNSDADGTGTGIYRVAANSLGFSANGVNAGQYSSGAIWTLGTTGATGGHAINGQLSITANQNAVTNLAIVNTSAGSSAFGQVQFTNDTANVGAIFKNSSTATAGAGAGSLNILNAGANPIGFLTNAVLGGSLSSASRWTLGVSGSFSGNTIYGVSDGTAFTTQSVGEEIFATIARGSNIALTSTVSKTITSISVTAGDWDIDCAAGFIPSGTTTVTTVFAGTSGTTDSVPSANRIASPNSTDMLAADSYSGVAPGGDFSLCPGSFRWSITATTTLFLVVNATFAISTLGGYGYIRARRRR